MFPVVGWSIEEFTGNERSNFSRSFWARFVKDPLLTMILCSIKVGFCKYDDKRRNCACMRGNSQLLPPPHGSLQQIPKLGKTSYYVKAEIPRNDANEKTTIFWVKCRLFTKYRRLLLSTLRLLPTLTTVISVSSSQGPHCARMKANPYII